MYSSEKQRLLKETLHDQKYEAFRSSTYEAGLRLLRSKRRRVIWPQILAVAASIALLLGLGFLAFREEQVNQRTESATTLPTFDSRPLKPGEVLRSAKDQSLILETATMVPGIEMVETKPTPLAELDDRELLAIFGNRPMGLVRHGNKAQLVILGN